MSRPNNPYGFRDNPYGFRDEDLAERQRREQAAREERNKMVRQLELKLERRRQALREALDAAGIDIYALKEMLDSI
jgi:hypothetical protein